MEKYASAFEQIIKAALNAPLTTIMMFAGVLILCILTSAVAKCFAKNVSDRLNLICAALAASTAILLIIGALIYHSITGA